MLPKLILLFVSPIIFHHGADGADITFKNVTVKISKDNNTTTSIISSSNNLKNHVADQFLESVVFRGEIPILYEDSIRDVQVKMISLYNVKLKEIEVGAFRNLSQLEILEIVDNRLTELEKGVFKELPKLTNLKLSLNRILSIEGGVLENPSVTHLDLRNNLVSSLDRSAFEKLPNLRELLMTSNPLLSRIEEGTFSNSKIENLFLDVNQISYMHSTAFDNMTQLQRVSLRGNKLTRYNDNWFRNCPNISAFDFGFNNIEIIGDHALKNIYSNKSQYINLRHNGINRIFPNAFRGLKKIDILNLQENKIQYWNDTFLEDTEEINHLNLGLNQLKCVDGDFDKIFKANYTVLEVNPLEEQCVTEIEEWMAKKENEGTVCFWWCDHIF